MKQENKALQRWVLIRGLARGRGHWGSFLRLFQEAHPGDEIECLDIPGNGELCHVASPLVISKYVDQMRSQSDFVRRGVDFKIVSVSLGGMITIEWMSRFPNEVISASIVCTSVGGISPFYERYLPHNILPTLKLGLIHEPTRWERGVLKMVVNNDERLEAELPELASYSKAHPQSVLNVVRQLWAASRFRAPAKSPGKIHLIGSYGDKLVSPQCTLKLAKKWGLTPTMHETAGHEIHLDEPRWLIQQIS